MFRRRNQGGRVISTQKRRCSHQDLLTQAVTTSQRTDTNLKVAAALYVTYPHSKNYIFISDLHHLTPPVFAYLLCTYEFNLQVSDDRLVLVFPLRQLPAGRLQLRQSALKLLAALLMSSLQLQTELLSVLLQLILQLKDIRNVSNTNQSDLPPKT